MLVWRVGETSDGNMGISSLFLVLFLFSHFGGVYCIMEKRDICLEFAFYLYPVCYLQKRKAE